MLGEKWRSGIETVLKAKKCKALPVKSGKLKLSNLDLNTQQCSLAGSLPGKVLHLTDLPSHLRRGNTLAKTMTVVLVT